MIPPIDREKIVQELEEFDKTLRDTLEWQGWENNRAQKWAIDYEGRNYPPKKIISMATGQPVNGFSGGIESNEYLKQRGFKIVSLREGVKSIQEGLETILDGYIPVRESEPFNSRNVIAETFEQVANILRAADVVRKRPTIKTVISYGKGNWANVPWIAFLDDRQTTTTQHGVYVVFLFKEDGTGVYLTYNQGVTDIIKAQGRQLGREQLQQLARERRLECARLSERGFLLDDTISLSEDAGLGRDYEASTIAHKLYLKGSVPNDDAILNDLEAVLAAYDQYVEHKFAEPTTPIPAPSKGHWLFQANPKIFDIRRALNNLRELTWTVNQMAGKFKVGQTGYLWESGPTGGIIAHATLLTDPMEMDPDRREEDYSIDQTKFTGKRLRVRVRIDQSHK